MSDLQQAEADALLSLEKRRCHAETYRLPLSGGKLCVPLESFNRKEAFTLDVTRGRISLHKGTYQHRARATVVLARLDFGGSPHRNPDDKEIGVPHIHLFREGFGDKWAFPVPPEHFPDTSDRWRLLIDFMRFCRITEPPEFERDLFA